MEDEKLLTNQEVVAELRGRVKPYIGVNMSQSTFSDKCIKINANMCKPETVQRFFKKFGYSGLYNDFKLTE